MSNLQASKTKKLMTVSKDDVTYQPFRKNFYVEVPELARMTAEGKVSNYYTMVLHAKK